MIGAWYARRDVRKDQIIPTVKRDQPISGGEVNARLPFGFRNPFANR